MKNHRLLLVLTVANFALLVSQMVRIRPVQAQTAAPMLRGRGFEIVDERGKVRAEIKVVPAGPARRADGSLSEANGKIYPETVQLRLIDPNGSPHVKLTSSVEGSGLLVGGDSSYAVLRTQGTDSHLELVNKDGRREVIRIKP